MTLPSRSCCYFHAAYFIRDVNFTRSLRGIGIVACVGRSARGLVQLDIRGEQLTVLALHTLHEDGLARVEVFNLLLGKFHSAQRLSVEEFVVLEDVFDAPAFGVDLDVGVELLAVIGNHAFDEHFLAFPQVVDFLVGQFHTFDFLRDVGVFRAHGDHLVGELVDADERRDVFAVAPFQFHHTPHVACLQQVLLVLFGEDVTEVRAFEFGFLADAVDT